MYLNIPRHTGIYFYLKVHTYCNLWITIIKQRYILNDKLFVFIQVDIETSENLKEKFSEMYPIFKNATIKFEDIGEYMQNFHNENNIKFKKLISSYFGNEIVWRSP